MKTKYPPYKNSSFTGIIGVAQEDITPEPGIYMGNWGAAKEETAKGIHRPLMLICCTFQSQVTEQPLVLIAADLGWWKNMEDERFLREGILTALSLPSERLMFCLSHTHAGPGLCRSDVTKPGGQFIEQYLLDVQRAAINTVNTALSQALPANLTWVYGKCNLAANRDLPEIENRRFLVGFNPDSNADDTLLTGRITSKEGQMLGTIVNYACHPTTLAWDNLLISPDYIGAMRDVVESATKVPCLFLQGASGELAPAEQYTGDTEVADKHGRQLGYAVLSPFNAMLSSGKELLFDEIIESAAPLAVWSLAESKSLTKLKAMKTEVPFTLKEMPSIAEIVKQWNECTLGAQKEKLWRKLNIRKATGDGDVMNIPLWIWQVGDALLIGQPNEAYSMFQQELRQRFSHNAVAVMNLVNGHMGYLPPAHLYEQDIYAVWQTPFSKGSLELLIQTSADLCNQLINEE